MDLKTCLRLGRTYVICELGINCNGDLSIAEKLISQAAEAGADCVKLQKRDIRSCYTPEELQTHRESPWGTTTLEQKAGLEFSMEQYKHLKNYAFSKMLDFTASPWDKNSVSDLAKLKVPFIKIPSALITDKKYLKGCVETHLPLLVSTGMTDLKLIFEIVKYIEDLGGQICGILHCTSTYPTASGEVNLKGIQTLERLFPKYAVGFSSHHRGIAVPYAAVVMGAKILEFHITLDRTMYGSDQAASLEPVGFHKLIRDVRDFELAKGTGQIVIYPSEQPIIKKLRKTNDFERMTP